MTESAIIIAVSMICSLLSFAAGALLVWFLLRRAQRSLEGQIDRRERTIKEQAEQLQRLLVSAGDAMGLSADPDLGTPKTHSRSRKKIRELAQRRKEQEIAEERGREYRPDKQDWSDGIPSLPGTPQGET